MRIVHKLEILRRFPGFDELCRPSRPWPDEGFRVNLILRRWLNNCKRRIQRRLDKADLRGCTRPMLTASNIHYEASGRIRGITHGGVGAIHALARQLGLIDAINQGPRCGGESLVIGLDNGVYLRYHAVLSCKQVPSQRGL